MVVVDSSALIPLAWVGRLDLVRDTFETIRTVDAVYEEVVVDGKPGAAVLEAFLEDVDVVETPTAAERVAELEGIALADAAVVLLASGEDEVLLANDSALIEVARSHDVDCWWVTTLVLQTTADGVLSAEEATTVLYDLVDSGMNLDPQVYVRIQRKLVELGS